jgi:hypothetical protein
MKRVLAKDNVLAALQRVERNKGAAGPDGMAANDLRNHLKAEWPSLKAALLSGAYVPQSVRRVDIPKPDGGTRQLGIPSAIDRFIQQMLLQVLTPIFDPLFSEHSVYEALDGWVRRRLRLCLWLQWKRVRTRLRHLRSMGLNERHARAAALNSLGPWRMVGANTLNAVMNKTYWRAQGLRCLMDHYRALQS